MRPAQLTRRTIKFHEDLFRNSSDIKVITAENRHDEEFVLNVDGFVVFAAEFVSE